MPVRRITSSLCDWLRGVKRGSRAVGEDGKDFARREVTALESYEQWFELTLHTNHLLDLGDYFNQIFLVLHHRFD